MKSTFGSNECQLLCINSSHDGPVERQDNPWAPYVSYFKDVTFFVFTSFFNRCSFVVFHSLSLYLSLSLCKYTHTHTRILLLGIVFHDIFNLVMLRPLSHLLW